MNRVIEDVYKQIIKNDQIHTIEHRRIDRTETIQKITVYDWKITEHDRGAVMGSSSSHPCMTTNQSGSETFDRSWLTPDTPFASCSNRPTTMHFNPSKHSTPKTDNNEMHSVAADSSEPNNTLSFSIGPDDSDAIRKSLIESIVNDQDIVVSSVQHDSLSTNDDIHCINTGIGLAHRLRDEISSMAEKCSASNNVVSMDEFLAKMGEEPMLHGRHRVTEPTETPTRAPTSPQHRLNNDITPLPNDEADCPNRSVTFPPVRMDADLYNTDGELSQRDHRPNQLSDQPSTAGNQTQSSLAFWSTISKLLRQVGSVGTTAMIIDRNLNESNEAPDHSSTNQLH